MGDLNAVDLAQETMQTQIELREAHIEEMIARVDSANWERFIKMRDDDFNETEPTKGKQGKPDGGNWLGLHLLGGLGESCCSAIMHCSKSDIAHGVVLQCEYLGFVEGALHGLTTANSESSRSLCRTMWA